MKQIDWLLEKRRKIAAAYASGLKSVSGLTVCHPPDKNRASSYWLFPVLVDKKAEFVSMLANAGIEGSPVHWRNDKYTIFKSFQCNELEGVDRWDEHMVCLPIGHWLDDDDVGYVIETVRTGHY
jgi:dTDP-4-amino-4,6-dideoxygalactose transaminase